MKKHSFLIAVATLMGFAQADAFKLQSTFTEDIIPERTIERDETGITVSYTQTTAFHCLPYGKIIWIIRNISVSLRPESIIKHNQINY